ncbi:hypothetical protein H1P_4780002 [Hyella patelloides LEGE 07179]|uniref:Uncharacterized protein n=2 Tax=Hyella TaxID=945733 RepID=A0A563VYY5_9CYAN|nr:hypothetical protein H1P_4780002 [Hyella patelloides LEGE 07179]
MRVEPFLEKAFSSSGRVDLDVPKLECYDKNPHIIFTGNASKLWTKTLRHGRKDTLGPFLKRLSQHDIHIFVKEKAETKGLSNLHLFPTFYNPDLMNGKFSQYISQFDAHLVMYNEFNGTSRRRVASGLATRFAYAIASTSPIALTDTSKFIEEYPQDTPFWFTFRGVKDLAESLHNKQLLKSLRNNMEKVHRTYAFESQSQHIAQFFEKILEKPGVSN